MCRLLLYDPLHAPPTVAPNVTRANDLYLMADLDEPFELSFLVLDAAPNISEGVVWWTFTSSKGVMNLSCSSTTAYNFSADCLSVRINQVQGSHGGLYVIVAETRAGIGTSHVFVIVRNGERWWHCMWRHCMWQHCMWRHCMWLHVAALYVAALYVAALYVAALYVAALHVVALHVVALYVAALYVAACGGTVCGSTVCCGTVCGSTVCGSTACGGTVCDLHVLLQHV